MTSLGNVVLLQYIKEMRNLRVMAMAEWTHTVENGISYMTVRQRSRFLQNIYGNSDFL